jgi:hypothetical protein
LLEGSNKQKKEKRKKDYELVVVTIPVGKLDGGVYNPEVGRGPGVPVAGSVLGLGTNPGHWSIKLCSKVPGQ